MADSEDRVRIELVDAGGHKDRVVLVLSKVKGLAMPPEQLVQHVPCTIATDVPRNMAEKLKEYLEKAGAMVMFESEQSEEEEEEELFSADEFPGASAFDSEDAGRSSDNDLPEFEAVPGAEGEEPSEFPTGEDDLTFTTDDAVTPPALPDEADKLEESEARPEEAAPKGNIFQRLLASLPAPGEKTGPKPPTDDAERRSSEGEQQEPVAEGDASLESEGTAPFHVKKERPDFLSSPLAYVLVGVVAGGLIMGTWGWLGIRSEQQKQVEYEIQTAQQIEEHSAQLKDLVAQLRQNVETLQQENAELQAQNTALSTELDAFKTQPAGMMPTGDMAPWEQDLVTAFQAVMERDAQILETSATAQQEAGCSQQVLLDGKGTLTYAQIVKEFSARYTRYDIRRTDSLMTPYRAELKIPFQQKIRTGATREACESATLRQLDTPPHHEFGGYYGYWTLEYAYQDGEWNLNTTVIKRTRARYERAFQKGSPDHAKFKIDETIFPDLGEEKNR